MHDSAHSSVTDERLRRARIRRNVMKIVMEGLLAAETRGCPQKEEAVSQYVWIQWDMKLIITESE